MPSAHRLSHFVGGGPPSNCLEHGDCIKRISRRRAIGVALGAFADRSAVVEADSFGAALIGSAHSHSLGHLEAIRAGSHAKQLAATSRPRGCDQRDRVRAVRPTPQRLLAGQGAPMPRSPGGIPWTRAGLDQGCDSNEGVGLVANRGVEECPTGELSSLALAARIPGLPEGSPAMYDGSTLMVDCSMSDRSFTEAVMGWPQGDASGGWERPTPKSRRTSRGEGT